mmetsp:Transcript_22825/g.32688  ORF Transcript_22825/g.32688 Transcript_22825/m.32688 type:complete len:163 (-) Transcript_22825:727-1215(-)
MVQYNNEKCDVQTSTALTLNSFEESSPLPQSTNTDYTCDYEKNSSSDPSTIDSSVTALRTQRLLRPKDTWRDWSRSCVFGDCLDSVGRRGGRVHSCGREHRWWMYKIGLRDVSDFNVDVNSNCGYSHLRCVHAFGGCIDRLHKGSMTSWKAFCVSSCVFRNS